MSTPAALSKQKAASRHDLSHRSTEDLRAELARSLELTAEHLLNLAAIWEELEKRGENLSSLRKGLAFYLPLIAAGQVDALAVVRFAGANTQLLRQVLALPMNDQRRLGQGGLVQTLEWNEQGHLVEVECDPLVLTMRQLSVVFSAGCLRPVAEQRTRLQASRQRHKTVAIRFDPNKRTIKVGSVEVGLAQVQNALAEKRPALATMPGKRTPILLRDKLQSALRARAAERNLSVEEMLEEALWMAGIVG